MRGSNKFEFNKENHLPDKKYDFYQDLFLKEEVKSEVDDSIPNEEYERVLNKHKIMSGVFFAISFASLLSLCIVSNSSGNIKKEMESNYQEVFATSLNLPPGEDNISLAKSLNQKFANYKMSAVIDQEDNDSLSYKIPSKFNKEGTPVKIEYQHNLYINDTVKFVFSDLDNTPFRALEKKVLLEKLTNKNFPGYNVVISQEGKNNLVAIVTKNPVFNYAPVYKNGDKEEANEPIILPVPPLGEIKKGVPENKVEVDISHMPVPVFIMPTDKNGEVKEQYRVSPQDFVN